MFRFTIRDMLWLMVVVGLACGWYFDRRRDVVRWKQAAEAREKHFECLLGQLEQAMPETVIKRDDGQVTVTTGNVPFTYPSLDILKDQTSY